MDSYRRLRKAMMAYLLWPADVQINGTSGNLSIARYVRDVSPRAASDLALELRHRYQMKHAPLGLAALMADSDSHAIMLKDMLPKLITRADDIREIAAIYWRDGHKPFPPSLCAGLRTAMSRFTADQLSVHNTRGIISDVYELCLPDMYAHADLINKTPLPQRLLVRRVLDIENENSPHTTHNALRYGRISSIDFLTHISTIIKQRTPYDAMVNFISSMDTRFITLDMIARAAANAGPFSQEILSLNDKILADHPPIPGHTCIVADVSHSSAQINNRRTTVATVVAQAISACEKVDVWLARSRLGERHDTKQLPLPPEPISFEDARNEITQLARTISVGAAIFDGTLKYIKGKYGGVVPDRTIIITDQSLRNPPLFTPRNHMLILHIMTRPMFRSVDFNTTGFDSIVKGAPPARLLPFITAIGG